MGGKVSGATSLCRSRVLIRWEPEWGEVKQAEKITAIKPIQKSLIFFFIPKHLKSAEKEPNSPEKTRQEPVLVSGTKKTSSPRSARDIRENPLFFWVYSHIYPIIVRYFQYHLT